MRLVGTEDLPGQPLLSSELDLYQQCIYNMRQSAERRLLDEPTTALPKEWGNCAQSHATEDDDEISMLFQWDNGNIHHIAQHENEPLDAGAVLRNGEARTVHLGETDAGRVLIVVVTDRSSMYRVVTARPVTRKERAFYSNHKAIPYDQDPTDP